MQAKTVHVAVKNSSRHGGWMSGGSYEDGRRISAEVRIFGEEVAEAGEASRSKEVVLLAHASPANASTLSHTVCLRILLHVPEQPASGTSGMGGTGRHQYPK